MAWTMDDACKQIADDVGICGPRGEGMTASIIDLAKQARCDDEIMTRPKFVAREITAMLDDMVKNP